MRFLLESNSNTYHVYHGSSADFEKFSHEFIGIAHSNSSGFGFNFTDSESWAQHYGNTIYEADITINNPFSVNELTITTRQIKNFIRNYVDPKIKPLNDQLDNTFYNLSKVNSGVGSREYENALNKDLSRIITRHTDDNEILKKILPFTKNKDDSTFDALIKIFHKDGFILPNFTQEENGNRPTVYIVFSNSQIKNLKKKHRGA